MQIYVSTADTNMPNKVHSAIVRLPSRLLYLVLNVTTF